MIVILSKAKDLTNYSARLTALVQDHAGKVDEENSEVPRCARDDRERSEGSHGIKMKAFYVYMMTNQSRVVLYTGITNSLIRRVWQHQSGEIEGFTKSYKVNRLVYYECFNNP